VLAIAWYRNSLVQAQTNAALAGQWSSVRPWPIEAIHAHMLPARKVMFWSSHDGPLLWNPDTENITPLVFAGYNIFCSGHALLADGRLLVTGGHVDDGVGLPNASIYDPVADSWNRLPDMNAARWYPTNTTLPNGDVLVISGNVDQTVGRNRVPQVWQTAAGTWRDLTGAPKSLPTYPWMHVAPNGKVFDSGPNVVTQYLNVSGTGSWTVVANRTLYRDYGSSVMYDDGKILIVGGHSPPSNTAEVIDLHASSPSWRAVQSMSIGRRQLNATLLPDGKVLVTGGTSANGFDNPAGAVHYAEMWDPATETWSTMASYSSYRGYHSVAVLLPSGRVLSAGGDYSPNAEIYSPPYLFKGQRPVVTSAPANVRYGQTFLIGTADSANIRKVTWIRLSSVTHAFNQNQRINFLSFTAATNGLNVRAPSDPNLCPPGHYMVFLLNGNGVPSIARIVRIRSA